MISDISLLPSLSPEALAAEVNEMIEHNFEGLIQILYRMDVSEHKLKEVLAANQQEDAGKLITAVILERLAQRLIIDSNCVNNFSFRRLSAPA